MGNTTAVMTDHSKCGVPLFLTAEGFGEYVGCLVVGVNFPQSHQWFTLEGFVQREHINLVSTV
jgi:hypothetical protein